MRWWFCVYQFVPSLKIAISRFLGGSISIYTKRSYLVRQEPQRGLRYVYTLISLQLYNNFTHPT